MRAYLLLVITMLFWAGNWIAGRAMVDQIPPVNLNFWRWVLAGAVLAPFVLPKLRGRWAEIRGHWRPLLLLGLFGMILFQVMLYYGLRFTEAINATLYNSILPIVMILVTWLFTRDRVTGRQILGMVISLFGVLVILSRGRPEAFLQLEFNIGDLIILAAMPVWAIYSNLVQRYHLGFSGLALSFLIICAGLVMQIPLVIVETAFFASPKLSWDALIAVVYVGVFSSALGIYFWNIGVREIGPNRAGFTIHLLPMFGAILAVLVLGETFHLFHAAGIGLILAGVFLSTVKTGAQTVDPALENPVPPKA